MVFTVWNYKHCSSTLFLFGKSREGRLEMSEMREAGYCFPPVLEGVNAALALVDAIIAVFAYFQVRF